MNRTEADRRERDRRCIRDGGRRSTDKPPRPLDSPQCPACRRPTAALEAGEADGGWWFVCVACDHMWDQRPFAAPEPAGIGSDAR
jgi:hypothetical protein